MATRMQQRKGTAAQWISTNGGDGPVLNAGEIGFELDTNKFKIGDGVNHWVDLTYFTDADSAIASVTDLIGGAPDLLNTLNELAAAVNDDPAFFTTVATNLSNHEADTMGIHGITDTAALATKTYADTSADTAVSTHNSDTTQVHGIADTADLATNSYVDTAVSTHSSDTTSVHGIADTSVLATQSDLTNAISTHNSDTTNVHGIGDISLLAIASTVATDISSAVSSHNSTTTNIHGITDTAELATKSYADTAEADAITAAGTAADTKISTAVAALTKSSVGLGNVDNTSDANKPVSTATQTALDLKAPKADPTFTGTVTGVTKEHVGLGNLDNTADVDKPVSDDTQDALDLKANLAGPTFTGTVTTDDLIVEGDLTVTGTTTTINATDLSITDPLIYLASNQYTEDVLDVGFLAATGAPGGTEEDHLHSGLFRDASDSKKWKLISNVPHPVANVVDITNATKETLVVGSLEATTVTPSSGVVFSDGTQTKEGVPSRTPIVQKTASYALSTLTHRDSLIEVSSTDATTITIPEDSTVDYPIGTTLDILQTNTGQVTIAPVSGSVTVNATPGLKLRTRWSSCTLLKRSANTWVVFGDLTA
jgi:hypothetical protein